MLLLPIDKHQHPQPKEHRRQIKQIIHQTVDSRRVISWLEKPVQYPVLIDPEHQNQPDHSEQTDDRLQTDKERREYRRLDQVCIFIPEIKVVILIYFVEFLLALEMVKPVVYI